MFPFKVRFSKTLKEQFDSEQIPGLLDISREILSDEGADYFSREGNRLKFENSFFRQIFKWNFMTSTDAGFVEILKTKENLIKVRYSVTLISIWIISFIISIIVFIGLKEILFALVSFAFLGLLNWLITLFVNRLFLLQITNRMKYILNKDKK